MPTWTTPKQDWALNDVVNAGDMNAMGEDLAYLKEGDSGDVECDHTRRRGLGRLQRVWLPYRRRAGVSGCGGGRDAVGLERRERLGGIHAREYGDGAIGGIHAPVDRSQRGGARHHCPMEDQRGGHERVGRSGVGG